MEIKNKFWWALAVAFAVGIIIFIVILLRHNLSVEELNRLEYIFKEYIIYITVAIFFFAVLIGMAAESLFNAYIIPLRRLAQETGIIDSVNPSHRVKLQGAKDVEKLCKAINSLAQKTEALEKDTQKQICKAKESTEAEKNLLAAIVAEFPDGIVICNKDGNILLYNKKAKKLLAQTEFIGLGRSIFELIDKACLSNALDEIHIKRCKARLDISSHFIISDKNDSIMRVHTVPIITEKDDFNGFMLILDDITRELRKQAAEAKLINNIFNHVRNSSSEIKTAIEQIKKYPDIKSGQCKSLYDLIFNESISLTSGIEKDLRDFSLPKSGRWPMSRIRAGEFFELLAKNAKLKLGIEIKTPTSGEDIAIKADTQSVMFSMLFIIYRLSADGCTGFVCAAHTKQDYAALEILWKGDEIKDIEELKKMPMTVKNESFPFTLEQVFQYHKAEIWSYLKPDHISCIRFVFPISEKKAPKHLKNVTVISDSRPEFYDFDLFSQTGMSPEKEIKLLTELSYTVFDTETTGLNPRAGDEIISIGAVRIVNGRILRDDAFEQLVDPKRIIPKESIKYHGITQDMVEGQPEIGAALNSFAKFAEGTVLVAHNAAFDMRMLKMKEAVTGIKFEQPVLDTMLLSAVVHKSLKNHNIENIAFRLGVNISGRHTALGDAISAGEIFIRLIPILAQNNIKTLEQAIEASKKTYFARLRY